jgi:hypothetical protein
LRYLINLTPDDLRKQLGEYEYKHDEKLMEMHNRVESAKTSKAGKEAGKKGKNEKGHVCERNNIY